MSRFFLVVESAFVERTQGQPQLADAAATDSSHVFHHTS